MSPSISTRAYDVSTLPAMFIPTIILILFPACVCCNFGFTSCTEISWVHLNSTQSCFLSCKIYRLTPLDWIRRLLLSRTTSTVFIDCDNYRGRVELVRVLQILNSPVFRPKFCGGALVILLFCKRLSPCGFFRSSDLEDSIMGLTVAVAHITLIFLTNMWRWLRHNDKG